MKTVSFFCLLLAGGVLALQTQALQTKGAEQTETTEREAAPLLMTVVDDLEAVKPIKPATVAYRDDHLEDKDRQALEKGLAEQYGFGSHNASFPLLGSEGIDTHPGPFNGEPANIEAVRAYKVGRYSYDKAPDALLWRWAVPAALQKNKFFLSTCINSDRYAALCLIPDSAAKTPATLYSFDSLTGLRWQTSIPVREAQLQYAKKIGVTIPKEKLVYPNIGARTGVIVAYDGSRTLVATHPFPSDATFLFVYDGEGTLLKTVVFPKCVTYANFIDSLATEGLGRAPKTNRFALTLDRILTREQRERFADQASVSETFLLSNDGDVQGRFVGEDGLPLYINRLSDTHALASVFNKEDKRNHRLLYELPK